MEAVLVQRCDLSMKFIRSGAHSISSHSMDYWVLDLKWKHTQSTSALHKHLITLRSTEKQCTRHTRHHFEVTSVHCLLISSQGREESQIKT